MLSPKRTKFRKQQTGKNRGIAWKGSDVSFGDFALQAVGRSFVTARQIATAGEEDEPDAEHDMMLAHLRSFLRAREGLQLFGTSRDHRRRRRSHHPRNDRLR